jgi:hypothetical protein
VSEWRGWGRRIFVAEKKATVASMRSRGRRSGRGATEVAEDGKSPTEEKEDVEMGEQEGKEGGSVASESMNNNCNKKDVQMSSPAGSQDQGANSMATLESKQKGNSSQACSASEDTEGDDNANADSKQKQKMVIEELAGKLMESKATQANMLKAPAPTSIDQETKTGSRGGAPLRKAESEDESKKSQEESPCARQSTSSMPSLQEIAGKEAKCSSPSSSVGTKQKKRSSASGNYSSSKSRGGKAKSSVSKYRGVAVHRWTGRWEAHIWENGKQLYLGSFETEDQAATAYDKAAIKLKKENAVLNFGLENYHDILERLGEMTKEELITSLRRDSAGFARGTSDFRGVSWRQQTGRWEARIGRLLGRKYTYLGTFKSGEAAARAYDRAAIISRGREAITNYHLSEYKEQVEEIEKATPEERRKMEEQLILRPQAVGAKQRRKRFEASTSDSQISGKSQTSGVSLKEEINNDDEGRRFKRIKSCPPAMLGEKLNPPKPGTSISVNLTINSSGGQASRQARPSNIAGSKSVKKERVSFQIKQQQNTGKKTKQQSQQRVFQRSLTGNMRVPRRVNDPSFPYQTAYNQGKYKQQQNPMYPQQHASVPRFKPAFPTPIEKIDLLIGDYFSGLPDGAEYTWNETVTDIERGYPEPVGAMLGMTGSETTFMHPPNAMGHPGYAAAYNTQDPRGPVDPIFNSQIPTQPFQFQSVAEERANAGHYLPEFDAMPLQQDNEHEMLPIEAVQADKSAQDELAAIDNIDGTNMTKILIDLGFSGENLFTWHT